MSRTFVFKRYDIQTAAHEYAADLERSESTDGDYVLAQDAIDREAVLQAQIRTLETQLKDARTASIADTAWAKPDDYARHEAVKNLFKFLNAAGGEGLVLDGVDGGDLFMSIFDFEDKIDHRFLVAATQACSAAPPAPSVADEQQPTAGYYYAQGWDAARARFEPAPSVADAAGASVDQHRKVLFGNYEALLSAEQWARNSGNDSTAEGLKALAHALCIIEQASAAAIAKESGK